MLNKYLILFIVYIICGINAQYDIGDACITYENKAGVCQYEHTCKYAIELRPKEIHASLCSYENRTEVVCCPGDHHSGVLSAYFEDTRGAISTGELTCHYDGYLPMFCCPTVKKLDQPPEPTGCPPLPRIKTPSFSNPAHTVVWEKCVANERYVNHCEQVGQSYKRFKACPIPITNQRISGGEPAGPNEFPHMAVLGCNNDIVTDYHEIVWIGGGSLISEKFILTAGHVLVSSYGRIRFALLGSVDKTDVRGGDLYHIIRLIPHKLYSSANKHHDIALVELNTRVIFSEFIRPICLPGRNIAPEDNTRLIAGWGQTGHKARSTNLLKKAILYEIRGEECKSSLSWPGFIWNDDRMICAQGMKSRFRATDDSCPGDSGGPLMYKVTNKEFSCNYVVAGVVSWGGVCGEGNPASYTRISAYLDWIVQTVWPEELKKAS